MNADIVETNFYNLLYGKVLSFSKTFPDLKSAAKEKKRYFDSRNQYAKIIMLHKLIILCLSDKSRNEKPTQKENLYESQIAEDIIEALTLLDVSWYHSSKDSKIHQCVSNNEQSTALHIVGLDGDSLKENGRRLLSKTHLEYLQDCLNQYLLALSLQIRSFASGGISQNAEFGSVVNRVISLNSDSENKRIRLERQIEKRRRLVHSLFSQLVEYETCLERLVEKIRTSDHAYTRLQFTAVSLKAYLMKLTCFEAEVLTKTYTQKSASKLALTNERLSSEQSALSDRLLLLEHKLSAYDKLDPRFMALTKEYSTLQNDLKFCSERPS